MKIYKDIVGPSETHLSKLVKLKNLLSESLGINYLSYFAISSQGYASLLSTNLEFVDYYLENKLFVHDPLLVHPQHLNEGALLWSSIENRTFEETIRGPMASQFNMDHALTIIRKSENPDFAFEGFGFATQVGRKNILNLYMNEMGTLRTFCSYLKENAIEVFRDAFSSPVNILDLKGKSFLESPPLQTGIQKRQRAELHSILDSSESAATETMLLTSTLSKQEERCLDLFLKGKSAKNTASILKLSRRTVEHYMDSVKNKLKCEKKSDLLEMFNYLNMRQRK